MIRILVIGGTVSSLIAKLECMLNPARASYGVSIVESHAIRPDECYPDVRSAEPLGAIQRLGPLEIVVSS